MGAIAGFLVWQRDLSRLRRHSDVERVARRKLSGAVRSDRADHGGHHSQRADPRGPSARDDGHLLLEDGPGMLCQSALLIEKAILREMIPYDDEAEAQRPS